MRCFPLVLLAGVVFAGTDPKARPEGYPIRAQARTSGQPVAAGGEFMVYSFSRGEKAYITPDFLVVEAALFPAPGATLTVDPSQFALRINGKKTPLLPQTPQLVAASLDHPEWRGAPRVQAGGGMGGVGVGIGQPRPPNIPGMPFHSRYRKRPRAPSEAQLPHCRRSRHRADRFSNCESPLVRC